MAETDRVQSSGAIGAHRGDNPPGMPSGAGVQSAAYAQAADAAKPIHAGMQQARGADRALETSSPSQTPQWKEANPSTPAQQAQQAGQTMHNAGVTTNATQSAETKAQVQSALDSTSKTGHNGPQQGSRCAAAQQQAASAPAPAPSQSMNK